MLILYPVRKSDEKLLPRRSAVIYAIPCFWVSNWDLHMRLPFFGVLTIGNLCNDSAYSVDLIGNPNLYTRVASMTALSIYRPAYLSFLSVYDCV